MIEQRTGSEQQKKGSEQPEQVVNEQRTGGEQQKKGSEQPGNG